MDDIEVDYDEGPLADESAAPSVEKAVEQLQQRSSGEVADVVAVKPVRPGRRPVVGLKEEPVRVIKKADRDPEAAARRAAKFGIAPVKAKEVTEAEIDDVYKQLKVSRDHHLRTVVLKGCDGMNKFQVGKIFAEYRPYRVNVKDSSALVHFTTRHEAATMMVCMTKRLRRIRTAKSAEDGEVMDSSDEEEGQIKNEGGDDVAVVESTGEKAKRVAADVVEVDVDKIEIPQGRWRCVVEHVPDARLVIVRYATHDELADARASFPEEGEDEIGGERKRRGSVGEDGFTYKWDSGSEKVRPGLNIFDEKGNELEWDYEHDTRFFEDTDSSTIDEQREEEARALQKLEKEGKQIKVRGRGAKKGLMLLSGGGSTLASDSAKNIKRKLVSSGRLGGADEDEEEDDDDDDLLEARDPSPTPQPWDRPRGRGREAAGGRLGGRLVFPDRE